MIQRLRRRALFVVVLVLSSLTAAVSYFVGTRHAAHASAVGELLAQVPAEARSVSPAVRSVLTRLEGERVTWWVARHFVLTTSPARLSNFEWHARNFLWSALLPYQLSEDELLGLYSHLMVFEEGRGLAHGAHFYLSKTPTELTEEETIGLLVISRAPRQFSPVRNPELYAKQVDRLLARYRSAI